MCFHFFLGMELVFHSLLLKNGDLETLKDDQGQVQSMQKLLCSVLEIRLASESEINLPLPPECWCVPQLYRAFFFF